MRNRKGVSLIVLVITIIIMIILAGSIILTLSNNGLITKASDAVKLTDLSNVKKLAILKWTEAFAENKQTQEELEQAVIDGLEESNIDISKYDIKVTTEWVQVSLKETESDTGEQDQPETDEEVQKYSVWTQTDKLTVEKGNIKLEIGDKINYIDKAGTNGSELYFGEWKVLGAENGKILIVSATNVTTKTLGSETDSKVSQDAYVNGIKYLNDVCAPYGTGNGANGAKCVAMKDVARLVGDELVGISFNDDPLFAAGQIIKYYWDSDNFPYYISTSGESGNLSDTRNIEITDFASFTWYDGTAWRTAKKDQSATDSKRILIQSDGVAAKIENIGYELANGSDGIRNLKVKNEKAYNAMFEHTEDFWLADKIVDSYWGPEYGFRGISFPSEPNVAYVSTSILTVFNASGWSADWERGVRVIVELDENVNLSGSSTNGWNIVN